MPWREALKKFLIHREMIISRPPGQFNVFDWKMAQLRARGARFSVILDGGAHEGGWSIEMHRVFPEATYVMVEPREEVQSTLREIAGKNRNFLVVQSLLGLSEGKVQFHHDRDRSSILPDATGGDFGRLETSTMTTIDRLFEGKPEPDFIKLDLQGAELDALKGGLRCLQHAQAVLLELSLMRFQKGQPVFAEVVAWMSERGFALYDICALWERKLDRALGQGDFLFLRENHPLRSDPRWSIDG